MLLSASADFVRALRRQSIIILANRSAKAPILHRIEPAAMITSYPKTYRPSSLSPQPPTIAPDAFEKLPRAAALCLSLLIICVQGVAAEHLSLHSRAQHIERGLCSSC